MVSFFFLRLFGRVSKLSTQKVLKQDSSHTGIQGGSANTAAWNLGALSPACWYQSAAWIVAVRLLNWGMYSATPQPCARHFSLTKWSTSLPSSSMTSLSPKAAHAASASAWAMAQLLSLAAKLRVSGGMFCQ